jgi:hypothetical protein
LPPSIKQNEWEVFGLCEAVFLARKDKLKSVFDATPGWVVATYWVVILAFPWIFRQINTTPGRRWAFSRLAILYLLVPICAYIDFRRNLVYLQKSREDQRARANLRRERYEKALWSVIAFVLGVIATLVTNHFRH